MKELVNTFLKATLPMKIGFCVGVPVILVVGWPLWAFLAVVLIGVWLLGSIGSILFGNGGGF